MEDKKKVPRLRFPGFTDDWEQRKLGDECNQLTTVINPQNEPNRLFAEYSMPAYDLNKNPDYVLGSTMNSARKVVDRPCLLINKLNVRKQRIWCIEDPEKNAVCSAEFIPVCSEGIDLRFLGYEVRGNAFTSYLEDCSSGSSNSQKRVTPDTIMNAEICIPSRAEQQKIGAYFRDLDHFITLHQRQLDNFKNLKKGCLQKMFPRYGETKPELRFPGFTDDWEQRKLYEVAEKICVGFVGTCEKYYTDESGIPMYRTGNLNGLKLNQDDLKYVTKEFHEQNKKSQLRKGDILIARHGDSGKAVNYELSEEANCLNIVIIRPDLDKCNYQFLADSINSPTVSQHIKSLSAGSTQAVINTSEIGKLDVIIPANIDEQNKIAKFLNDLDTLITLHQRELDELNQFKKGMLQQMFV